MPALSKSIKRSDEYRFSGVVGILAWPTFRADGTPTATYTVSTDGSITAISVVTDQTFVLEGEYNEVSFSDNTTIGVNRFPLHQLAVKFAGRSDALSDQIKAIDLGRHTFLIRTSVGKCILLGRANGLIANQSNSGSGSKAEDFFGYDIQVSGAELEKAKVIPGSVYVGLAADADITDPAVG